MQLELRELRLRLHDGRLSSLHQIRADKSNKPQRPSETAQEHRQPAACQQHRAQQTQQPAAGDCPQTKHKQTQHCLKLEGTPPSPLKRARSQASQLLQSQEEETQAALEQFAAICPHEGTQKGGTEATETTEGRPGEEGTTEPADAAASAAQRLEEATNLAQRLHLPDVERLLREARELLPTGDGPSQRPHRQAPTPCK